MSKPIQNSARFGEYLRVLQESGASHSAAAGMEWPAQSLERDILDHAMRAIAALLTNFPPGVLKIDEGVVSLSKSIVYRDVRIHIVGTTAFSKLSSRLWSEIVDKSRESLVLCLLPGPGLEIVNQKDAVPLDVRTGAIALYPADIDALARDLLDTEQLIEYKLLRRIAHERPDAETQFHQQTFEEYCCAGPFPHIFEELSRAIEARGERESDWLEHPYLFQLSTQLSRFRHGLLFGYSASGKSVLSFQVGRRLANAGWHVAYRNLSDDLPILAGLVQSVLFAPSQLRSDFEHSAFPNRLIIVDDLQSRPAVARVVLTLASLTQRVRERSRPVVLGVSWKEFAAEAAELCPEALSLAMHANMVRDRLLEKYNKTIDTATLAAIAAEIGDDLYLLRLMLDATATQKNRANREEVAENVWQARTEASGSQVSSEVARRVALLASSIGQFDIHVPIPFLEQQARADTRTLEKLIEGRLLRRIGERVTLGHRSLCALMAWWLGKHGGWQELEGVGGPANVPAAVLAFLTAVGTVGTIETLRAVVSRAGFKSHEALSQRAAAIMELWRAFDAVVDRVERQQTTDPTWGNTPSSSFFVAFLLSQLGKTFLAEPSLEFLRGHWSIQDGRLAIDTTGFSTVVDFELLKQKILDEDKEAKPQRGVETGIELDIDRFHKTWLAGLILGAEAEAERPHVPLDQLAATVERQQLRPSGAFYPQRVPWCTARVLLGLASCGRNMHNSRPVADAVRWLLSSRADGGAVSHEGIWLSGTGQWNTAVETTSLVLLALVRVGLDPADSRLEAGRGYLLSQRDEWPGLEGAVAIEALLATGSKWEDLAADTARLCQRALDKSLWLRATLPADEIRQQTCHVAQAATHLVGIGWAAIQADLKGLLDALDLPAGVGPPPTQSATEPAQPLDIQPVHASEMKADMAAAVRKIDTLELSRFRVVGDYLRFEDRARTELTARYHVIRHALERKTLNRENHLIWAPPGSGKTYFASEIARNMQGALKDGHYKVINLASMSHTEFKTALAQLKDIHDPLLCMIDEIDGRSTEPWPYDELFSCLDWNSKPTNHIVFVLIGSGGSGLNGMMRAMRERKKGGDLIDRIPESNRFEIPQAIEEDRLLVFSMQLLVAAGVRHQKLEEIERLALYYALKNESLSTPRQLEELAKYAVGRMEASETQLMYDHLFRFGDPKRSKFFVDQLDIASSLQGSFVRVAN